MRAVLYARVSSEEQVEGYSIDAQIRSCRNHTQEKGWVIVNEYVDEGKSARSEDTARRPKFKAMLRAASDKAFDVLIVHKLDRFSRNLIVTLKSFEELSKNNITFISVSEQIDYTTPMGKVFLAMSGAFAQFYSDNLSTETKKGWHERRAQGLYCGALPFGAAKSDDGTPMPDMLERKTTVGNQEVTVKNYAGLKMAFELARQGSSDRDVAIALNASGYRTTGTHGSRPFSRDTLRDMLTNRFYIGYIPDGNGGWLKARHEPFIEVELLESVQNMRAKNRKSTHGHSPRSGTIYSLTGITYCWHCKENGREGRIHVSCVKNGKPRLGCYNRAKGWECTQRSSSLELYEQQVRSYLQTFSIPDDYQNRILDTHRKISENYDVKNETKQLKATLERTKELYQWGDIDRAKYQREKARLQSEMAKLVPFQDSAETLKRLADFLANITAAWDEANPPQKNSLLRCLFQEIWVKDKDVVAVKPQPEFEPFFELNWDEFSRVMKSGPQAPSGSPVISRV